MRLLAATTVTLLASSTALAGNVSLGPAAGYNVFVFGTHTAQNSDVEGRIAVGGAATYQNYSLASAMPQNSDINAVFGSSITWSNGTVKGGLRYGTTASLASASSLGGNIQQGSVINFTSAATQLQSLSQQYAAMVANGTTYVAPWNAVTLTGASTGVNIFTISASALAAANELTITAPAGSAVLINVSGTAASMQNFSFFLNGVTASDILFNFADATSLTASGIGIKGSILAPNAAVTFNNGHMDGQMIASTLQGTGEFHNFMYSGELAVVPLPAAAWTGGAAMFMLVAGRRLSRRR